MNTRFEQAIAAFDAYHGKDPNTEMHEGVSIAKELLYAQRMTHWLTYYAPSSPEYMQLAARCQHIGRWEISRNDYPRDKKGYLQWRNAEKIHHAALAGQILQHCGYDATTIDQVKFLLLKKELFTHADTQLLEDVVCLVFVEYYLEDFARQHDDAKVVDILRKTLKKMSARAIDEAVKIPVSKKMSSLIAEAAQPLP